MIVICKDKVQYVREQMEVPFIVRTDDDDLDND